MLRPSETDAALSVECALAGRPGYEDLHRRCRRTADVPLPGTLGLLLMSACPCSCHAPGTDATR
ncbi:hypothetical protein [Streptomyces europaeiscabiei]|uniref:hypothetical protein n=1 Tax=Streptomyces europaeiscabiei TaxID=146819 RepID=UPI0029A1B257|nr:hypothetical protein [Streptomyces europaeiscabiei]MDX3782114.1 hypothetical protein [Streptomyces europaeiscabiei]